MSDTYDSSAKAGGMIQTTQSFEARGPENRVIDVARALPTAVRCGIIVILCKFVWTGSKASALFLVLTILATCPGVARCIGEASEHGPEKTQGRGPEKLESHVSPCRSSGTLRPRQCPSERSCGMLWKPT